MRLLDCLPWVWLTLIAIWLAIAPIFPEPHLVEKLRLLVNGELTKALDIFDFLFHAVPLLLLAAMSFRGLALRKQPVGLTRTGTG